MDSYRINHHHPPEPDRDQKDITTPGDFKITNGAQGVMAYPCFYYALRPPVRSHPHSQRWHDHIGMPSPNHPDHICQEHIIYDRHKVHPGRTGLIHLEGDLRHDWNQTHAHIGRFLDMSTLTPIHLGKEGYTDFRVDIEPGHDFIEAYAALDERDDWVVRVYFNVQDQNAKKRPCAYRFSVHASGIINGIDRSDVLVHGRIIVYPAWLDGEGENDG